MRSIKLLVFFFFCLFALTFFGQRWTSAVVNSQSGPPAAPTGVSASDGDYADKVGLNWDTVRGATLYRIYRATTNNPATAADVGTTPANYFFDPTAAVNQTYFYWVKAENGAAVSVFSAADQGRRAAGTPEGSLPPLDPPFVPAGNAVTAAKASLGKALFWDEQLSSTKTVSCGTCHRPAAGGSDPRTIVGSARARNPGFDNVFNTADDVFGSPGVPVNNADGTYTLSSLYGFNEQTTGRKSPSYLNAAYTSSGLFWDGRAADAFRDPVTNALLLTSRASLETQVLGPPLSTAEMGHGGRSWPQVAARVAASRPLALASNIPNSLRTWIGGRTYPQLFEEAFGTPEVTPARIAMAIATHERTLFTDRTPLDRWAAGIEPLTPQEDRGRVVYFEALCSACHGGALLSDQSFHNIGVRPQGEDLGRAGVTNLSEDSNRFKTPGLRNVELRAPYMRNGRFATLEEVVEFYNRGGDFPNQPNIDKNLIRPLNLTAQQKADLVAFMKRPMTDPRVRGELPPFDRPQLYTESTRVPVVTGAGRAGTGGLTPQPVAIEPPLAGNPSFTVAVARGLGGAQAVLVIDSSDPGVGSSIPAAGSFARQTVTLQGSGAGNGAASIVLSIPADPSLVGRTFFGRWYVADASAANGFSVSPAFRFTVFGDASAPQAASFVDFDGDRKTDVSIYRTALGQWWYQRSSDAQVPALQFGSATDVIVPGDYTGDGKTDVAVFRPASGQWFVLRSEDNSFYSFPFGAAGDVAAPADYDGDGRADAAVFRPSSATWFIQGSQSGTQIIGFGAASDAPAVADYDGDGKSDLAIFRAGGANGAEWWIRRSTDGQVTALQFGVASDKAVPADYTGDRRADIAFFRPASGEWFVLRSEDFSYYAAPFGASGDVPAPGDYDGDGKTDLAVWRPSNATWYAARSTSGLMFVQFGASGDRPVPNAYVP